MGSERVPAGSQHDVAWAQAPAPARVEATPEQRAADREATGARAVQDAEILLATLATPVNLGAAPEVLRRQRASWFEKRATLEATIGRARRSASPDRTAELQAIEARVSALAPPLGYRPVAGEERILELFAAPLVGGAQAGVPARIAELHAAFDELSVEDSRQLALRIADPAQHDPLYPHARGRLQRRVGGLIVYLRDAGRRQAMRREAERRRDAVTIAPDHGGDSAVAENHDEAAPAIAPPGRVSAAAPRKTDTPTHDGFEAKMDYELDKAQRAGELVTAPAYLHLHMKEVRRGIGSFLAARKLTTGNAQVAFVPDVLDFLAELAKPFATDDDSSNVQRLRAWLAPTDVYALVDRNRAVFAEADPDAMTEYTRGPKGATQWVENVAIALGSELEKGLRSSLPRMSGRLVAATAIKRVALNRPTATVQHAAELVPSTHLDREVAFGLIGRDSAGPTVEVTSGKGAGAPPADAATEQVNRIEWQGSRGGPWTAVRVIEPATATAESLAAYLMGSPTEAYRLRQSGVFWIVPDNVAARFPEAGARPRGAAQTAPDVALAFGAHAADGIAAEQARGAHGPGPVNSATAAGLTAAWTAVANRLHAIAFAVAPLHLDVRLAAALTFHAVRQHDLASLHAHDADARATSFASQEALLILIAGELAPAMRIARAAKHGWSPGHDAALALVVAASVAHLPETCRAHLDALRITSLDAIDKALETNLAEALSLIEVSRQQELFSASPKNLGFTARAEALRMRLADARTQAPSAEVLGALQLDIANLKRDAKIVAEIGSLRQLYRTLDKLEDDGWTLFSEGAIADVLIGPLGSKIFDKIWGSNDRGDDNHIGRLEALRRGSFSLGEKLKHMRTRWLAIGQRASSFAEQLAGADVENAKQLAQDTVMPELLALDAELTATLADVGKNTDVRTFLTVAAQTMKDASHRAIATNLIMMLAIATVSGGLGGAVGGAVAAEGTVGALAGIAVDSALYALIETRISGSPFWLTFAETFAMNAAIAGASHAASTAFRGTKMGLTLVEAERGVLVAKSAIRNAKLVELSLSTLVGIGTQLAAAELQEMILKGEPMTGEQVADSAVQASAMAVGFAVFSHFTGHAAPVGREAQHAKVLELANEMRQHGTAARVGEMLRGARELLAVDPKDASPEARDARATRRAIEKFQDGPLIAHLSLHAEVPGEVYGGTREEIAGVIEQYRALGYTANAVEGGYELVGNGEAAGLRLREMSGGAPRVEAAGTEAARSEAPRTEAPEAPRRSPEAYEAERAKLHQRTATIEPGQIDAEMAGKGHSGVELHSHMMGNVDPTQFRDQLAATGKGGLVGDVSTWEPLLRKVVALETTSPGLKHEWADKRITKRGAAGDAIEQASNAVRRIGELKTVLLDSDVTPTGRENVTAKINEIAESAVRKAFQTSDETDFNSSYEVRDEMVKDFYGARDRELVFPNDATISAAATALAQHFGGRPAMEARVKRAVELEAKREGGALSAAEQTELATLTKAIRQQFGYDAYTRDTLIRLAEDNVTYTEQSNSLKKMMERFDEDQLPAMKAEARKLRPDLTAQLDALEAKHLVMVNTREFGERGATRKPGNEPVRTDDVTDKARSDEKAFRRVVADAVTQAMRRDAAGIDIAGAEHFLFDALGAQRFEYLYDQLAEAALQRGKPLVLRPHVGEGANDVIPGEPYGRDHSRQKQGDQLSHYQRAEENLDTMLTVLEKIASRPENRAHGGRLPPEVIVRFGHATHATPQQCVRMARLGVIAEANLSSNVETGALARNKPEAGAPDVGRPEGPPTMFGEDKVDANLRDHSLGSLIFSGVEVVPGTDAHSVMNTTLSKEYSRAEKMIAGIRGSEISVPITVEQAREMNQHGGAATLPADARQTTVEVTYPQMSDDKKRLFDTAYRKLFEDSARYGAEHGANRGTP